MKDNDDRKEFESVLLDRSDDSTAKDELEKRIECQQILGKLPLRIIFGNLSDYELSLFRLIILEENSVAEVAERFGTSAERIARDLNKLRAKIRARTKSVLKGTSLEHLLAAQGVTSGD